MKIAFVLGDSCCGIEIVQFIRGQDLPHPNDMSERGEMYHIAMTVADPETVSRAISHAGGEVCGTVTGLPNGIQFVHCLDPWGNVLELMTGSLEELVGV